MQDLLSFAAGLAGLVVGANLLVRGASRLALSFGISPLVVGLTVVALGTSAPEVAVSLQAVLGGTTDLAVGNVVGSNIFNVLFILGASALVTPLVVHDQVVRQEVPLMFGASLLLVLLGLDGRIGAAEGGLLFTLLLAYVGFVVAQSRRRTRAGADGPDAAAQPAAGAWDTHLPVQLALIAAGLAALVLGSDALVSASVAFARRLGVSDLVIGLTIVAAGTSMPEAATSVAATMKGERDIAVGNAVGSSIFNILGCLGLAAMASGSAGLVIPQAVRAFDLWVMLAVALACLPLFIASRTISRCEGALLLGYYAAYIGFLVMQAQQHAALPFYSRAMLQVVLPLTAVTLVGLALRPFRR